MEWVLPSVTTASLGELGLEFSNVLGRLADRVTSLNLRFRRLFVLTAYDKGEHGHAEGQGEGTAEESASWDESSLGQEGER